jgi:hypothetical protein
LLSLNSESFFFSSVNKLTFKYIQRGTKNTHFSIGLFKAEPKYNVRCVVYSVFRTFEVRIHFLGSIKQYNFACSIVRGETDL